MNLDKLKKMFQEAKEMKYAERKEYEQSCEYYHNNQLSDEVLAILKERGQPPQSENIFAMLVNKVLGYKNQEQLDIQVLPTQERNKDLAILLSNILESLFDYEWQKESKKLFLDLANGVAIAKIWCVASKTTNKWGEPNKELHIKRIDPKTFYIDPYSKGYAAKDSRYFHHIQLISLDEAKKLFKGKITPSCVITNSYGSEFVRVVETWYKENDAWHRVFWNNETIFKSEKNVLSFNKTPYVVQKFNIDEKNNFYGFLRTLKPVLDFINYAENRMANMLNSTKVFYEKSAVDNPEEFERGASMDNVILPVRDGALSGNKIRVDNQAQEISQIAAKVNEKRNTAQFLVGFNSEMLGFTNTRVSTETVMQRNRAGVISLELYMQSTIALQKNMARMMLDYIQHYFDTEQVFRLVDKENYEIYYQTINEAVQENGVVVYENGKPKMNNAISFDRYDIQLTVRTDSEASERKIAAWSEVFKTLSGTYPELILQIMPFMMGDVSDPVYRKVATIIQNYIEQMQQNPKQDPNANFNQAMQQLMLEEKQADINVKKSKTAENVARSQYHLKKTDNQGERNDL